MWKVIATVFVICALCAPTHGVRVQPDRATGAPSVHTSKLATVFPPANMTKYDGYLRRTPEMLAKYPHRSIGLPPIEGSGKDPVFWTEMLAQVQRVIVEPDLVLRNLQVTWSYYQIGQKFNELLGTDGQNGNIFWGNWAFLAVYASNSVGMSIRKQTFQNWITEELDAFPAWIRKPLAAALKVAPNFLAKIPAFARVLDGMSKSLSGGNTSVFNEIASWFCKFGQLLAGKTTAPDAATWQAFIDGVKKETGDHSPDLDKGFQNYYDAMFTAQTGAQKALFLFLGNMYTGYAEQTYLDSYIRNSFPKPISINLPWPIKKTVSVDFSPIATKMVMSLVMPEQILWLGNNVPPRNDHKMWDDAVSATNMQLFPELYKLYVQLVGQATSLENTAATDWRDFNQRMRYIVPLFRGRQNDKDLNCPPLSVAQMDAAWINGDVPKESDLCLANCCEKNGRSYPSAGTH